MARILHKGKQSDDRTNFMKSTLVAARYLKDRCRNLNNDWLLIAASYNCGVGNVGIPWKEAVNLIQPSGIYAICFLRKPVPMS